MKLVVQEFLTLDSVSQGPGTPDEDTSDGFTRGGWFVPHLDEAFEALAAEWPAEADAFPFGRRTYEDFARDRPRATGRRTTPAGVSAHVFTVAGTPDHATYGGGA